MAEMAGKLENLVLWSDGVLLAINKPAGLPTLPDGYHPEQPYVGSLLEPDFGRVWFVHRLDRQTSGILVLALSAESHRSLNCQFEKRQVSKNYHGLVQGNPSWTEKLVKLPLRPNGDRRHRTVVDPRRGKPCQTELRVLERFGKYALVEAIPRTGRTHQVRAHLAALGLPLVGDSLYGDGAGIFLSKLKPGYQESRLPERALIDRLGLHARTLSFAHPLTGEKMCLEAPYPKDFGLALRQLRKHCSPGAG